MPQDIWNEASFGYSAPGGGPSEADVGYAPSPASQPGGGGSTLSYGFNPTPGGRTYNAPAQKETTAPRATSGGGGFQYKPATGFDQTTTQTTTLPGQLPTFTAPTFTAPERDDARVQELTQKFASPGARALRRSTKLALLRQHYDDPRGRERVRAALAGQGEGLSQVYGGASRTAIAAYEAEYGKAFQAAGINFQSRFAEQMTNFKAKVQDRMTRGVQTSTTKRTNRYTTEGGSDSGASRFVGGHFPRPIYQTSNPTIWGA